VGDGIYAALDRSSPVRSSGEPIVVRAPATSANLGPGFDCLGLALDLWNEVSAVAGAPIDEHNLIVRAARTVFDTVGAPFPGFALSTQDGIPFSRGLGSSAAAIACGLLIGNRCLGQPLDQADCLRLAVRIEGHPDNVVPCLLGGVRVAAVNAAGQVVQAHVPLRVALRAVVFVPEQHVLTNDARGLLPSSVSLSDAQFNVARAGLLVAALAGGELGVLAEATRDRLHQPYRLALVPAGSTLLDAAMQAGALGAYVSGAGPSILALSDSDDGARAIARAFNAVADAQRVPGSTCTLSLSERGAHVVG
jgi:homoserine kinase